MSDAPQTFGDFVVGCEPIIRHEVARLMRMGVTIPPDDATQDGFLILLENESSFNHMSSGLAAVIIRRRLINRYVKVSKDGDRRPGVRVRARSHVNIDALEGGLIPRLPSPEDEVVERVTLKGLMQRFPEPTGSMASRQAVHQRRWTWIRRMSRYVSGPLYPRERCGRGHDLAVSGRRRADGTIKCRECERRRRHA